ncbi:MAG: hypothetical protein ACYC1D_14155 [Acidimicrobiales bacterium]
MSEPDLPAGYSSPSDVEGEECRVGPEGRRQPAARPSRQRAAEQRTYQRRPARTASPPGRRPR